MRVLNGVGFMARSYLLYQIAAEAAQNDICILPIRCRQNNEGFQIVWRSSVNMVCLVAIKSILLV